MRSKQSMYPVPTVKRAPPDPRTKLRNKEKKKSPLIAESIGHRTKMKRRSVSDDSSGGTASSNGSRHSRRAAKPRRKPVFRRRRSLGSSSTEDERQRSNLYCECGVLECEVPPRFAVHIDEDESLTGDSDGSSFDEYMEADKTIEELLQESSRNLIVNYLPSSLRESQLAALFEPFGTIKHLKIVIDIPTGKSRGFGFILFEDPMDAARAQHEMHGFVVEGKKLKVAFARPQSKDIQNSNLYVANLPKAWDARRLRKEFQHCGTIVDTRVLVDETGKSKGTGFVRMHSHSAALQTIREMNGVTPVIGGRTLIVKLAQRKSEEGMAKKEAAKLAALQQQHNRRIHGSSKKRRTKRKSHRYRRGPHGPRHEIISPGRRTTESSTDRGPRGECEEPLHSGFHGMSSPRKSESSARGSPQRTPPHSHRSQIERRSVPRLTDASEEGSSQLSGPPQPNPITVPNNNHNHNSNPQLLAAHGSTSSRPPSSAGSGGAGFSPEMYDCMGYDSSMTGNPIDPAIAAMSQASYFGGMSELDAAMFAAQSQWVYPNYDFVRMAMQMSSQPGGVYGLPVYQEDSHHSPLPSMFTTAAAMAGVGSTLPPSPLPGASTAFGVPSTPGFSLGSPLFASQPQFLSGSPPPASLVDFGFRGASPPPLPPSLNHGALSVTSSTGHTADIILEKSPPPISIPTPKASTSVSKRCIKIRSLPDSFTTEDLLQHFNKFGVVESVRIEQENGSDRIGFVNYPSQTDALSAAQASHVTEEGHTLLVSLDIAE